MILWLRRWWQSSIRRRLWAASILTLLTFLILLGYLSLRIARTSVRHEVNQRNSQMASLVAQEINAQFNTIWSNVRLFAYQLEEASDALLRLQARAMIEQRRIAPLTYRAFYLFDAEGEMLIHLTEALDDLLTISPGVIIQRSPISPPDEVLIAAEAAQAGDLYLSHAYIIGADQVPVVYMGIPIHTPTGSLQQIFVAEIDLRDIWRRIDEIQIGQTGRAFLISGEGIIIAHPDRSYIGAPAPEALRAVLYGYEGRAEYVPPDKPNVMLAAYSPVGGRSGWGVVIEQERTEAFATVDYIGFITPVVILIAVGIATMIIGLISQEITYPIQRLVEATTRIARTGNLSEDIAIQRAEEPDEVGQLAEAFNQMIASLRQAEREIANHNRTLESQVRQRTQELEAAYLDMAEQRETLDVIFQSIADGLVVIDQEEHIQMVNPVVTRFLRRPTKELVGQEVAAAFASAELQHIVSDTLTNPDHAPTVDIHLPEGRVLRASVNELKRGAAHATGVVLVLRDVTQEIAIDRMKTDFVSMVSHELRTPLTSVLGFVKLVQKQFERYILPDLDLEQRRKRRATERIRGNLTIILSEGERLTRMINNVLDVAKMEEGRFEWDMNQLHIDRVIEQAVAANLALIKTKKLKINVEAPADLPPLYADHDRLAQVIMNLLSNAIKYTDEGKITVRAQRLAPGDTIPPYGLRQPNAQTGLPATRSLIAVSVQDTGAGIAEEDLLDVFEKFKQVGDITSEARRPGTGLGLPICKQIIEYHDGHIWVESQESAGSRFIFTLPARDHALSPP